MTFSHRILARVYDLDHLLGNYCSTFNSYSISSAEVGCNQYNLMLQYVFKY